MEVKPFTDDSFTKEYSTLCDQVYTLFCISPGGAAVYFSGPGPSVAGVIRLKIREGFEYPNRVYLGNVVDPKGFVEGEMFSPDALLVSLEYQGILYKWIRRGYEV